MKSLRLNYTSNVTTVWSLILSLVQVGDGIGPPSAMQPSNGKSKIKNVSELFHNRCSTVPTL